MTDEHQDDPDPRGPDFDDPETHIDRATGSWRFVTPHCPVCGEEHKAEDSV